VGGTRLRPESPRRNPQGRLQHRRAEEVARRARVRHSARRVRNLAPGDGTALGRPPTATYKLSLVARTSEARIPLGVLRRDSHARAEAEQNLTQGSAGISYQLMDISSRPTLTNMGKRVIGPVIPPPLEPGEHHSVAVEVIDDRGNKLSRTMKL
jgi:hypothetical protein